MNSPVPFNVYLQALGGKFLGPNAYNNSGIQLTLQYSGGPVTIPYVVAAGTDDGNISPVFTGGSTSFLPILTMPVGVSENPDVNYLTPDANTIAGRVNIVLPDTNETATLLVSIPTPSGIPLQFSQPVLLSPQQEVYNITVVVPGLLLTANSSTPVPPGNISVFVAMMCGCKVTTGNPTSFWTYTDFSVSAIVTYTDGTQSPVDLPFNQGVNLSLFSAPVANYNNIKQINFFAQQKSTGNYGMWVQ